MPRDITGSALAKIQQKTATEPVIIIEVTWGFTGPTLQYADRDFETIPGKIISLSSISSGVKVGSVGGSGGVTVELDDTDGSIKTIFNDNDVQRGVVSVFQTYGSLTASDKFLLFKGQINTPVTFNEQDKTISFEALTFAEDEEIGFSPEEGEFDFIADSAIGKAWPLCFGSPIRVPAVKITEAVRGTSLTRYGLITLANLNTLCARARSIAAAQRQKDLADVNTGLLDGPYSDIVDNLNQAIVSVNVFIEALLSDSPTQETDVRAYAVVCENLDREEANAAKALADFDVADAAVDASEAVVNSLQAQILQAQAATPVDVPAVAALQAQLAVQQSLLTSNNNDRAAALITLAVANSNIATLETTKAQLETTIVQFVITTIEVDGGERFPQGVSVNIIIKGVKFKGIFVGRIFTIEESNLPIFTNLSITQATNENEFLLDDATLDLKGQYCFLSGKGIIFIDNQIGSRVFFSPLLFEQTGQLGTLVNVLINGQPFSRRIFEPLSLFGSITETSVVLRQSWLDNLALLDDFAVGLTLLQESDYSIEIGDEVFLDGFYTDTYIANLIPSLEVFEVVGRRDVNGESKIVPIPSRYFKINLSESIAGQTSTTLRMLRPLKDFVDENWSGEIFVSLRSSVGPNTVDIIEHLVDTYTTFSKNAASFTSVKTSLDPFPSHFAILDRPSAFKTIEDIAWQARCAAIITNDEILLRYLASSEAAVETISESEIEVKTFNITLTSSDDLVTKFVAEWLTDYTIEKMHEVVFRNNIPKYGEIEQRFSIFIYNIKELVEQTAFFWMIRFSNTWKLVQFSAFLDNLRLENFDPVTLNFVAELLADASVKGVVTSVEYDSQNYRLDFEIQSSVRAGEMTEYPFFFPASADPALEYPTVNDLYAGGAA